MVKEVLDGISIKLNAIFGDGVQIYADEEVVQDMQRPCFFIAVLNVADILKMGGRHLRQHAFDIHYFPQRENDIAELHDTAEIMLSEMDVIELADTSKVRGTKISYEQADGVLHILISYDMFLAECKEHDPMETLLISTGTH